MHSWGQDSQLLGLLQGLGMPKVEEVKDACSHTAYGPAGVLERKQKGSRSSPSPSACTLRGLSAWSSSPVEPEVPGSSSFTSAATKGTSAGCETGISVTLLFLAAGGWQSDADSGSVWFRPPSAASWGKLAGWA